MTLTLLSGLLVLFSCTRKKAGVLEFGYGHHVVLSKGEKVAELDTSLINKYERLVNHHQPLNIPLTRTLISPRYMVYIGICVDGSYTDLRKAISLDSIFRKIRTGKDWLFVQNQKDYLVLKTHDNGKQPPYCITVVSPDSLFTDSVANGRNPLFERFSFYAKD